MNLQNSSSVSLIAGNSGVEGVNKIGSGLIEGAVEGGGEAFTNTLLQQLAMLQQAVVASGTRVQVAPPQSADAGNSIGATLSTLLHGAGAQTPEQTLALLAKQLTPAANSAVADITQLLPTQSAATTPTPGVNPETTPTVMSTVTDSLQELRAILNKLVALTAAEPAATPSVTPTVTPGLAPAPLPDAIQQISALLQKSVQSAQQAQQQQGATQALQTQDVQQQITRILDESGIKEQLLAQPAGMQELTALVGKSLPTDENAAAPTTDIDSSLQALVAVLVNLASKVTTAEPAQPALAKNATAPTTKLATDVSEQNTLQLAMAQASAVQAPVLTEQVSQIIAPEQMDTGGQALLAKSALPKNAGLSAHSPTVATAPKFTASTVQAESGQAQEPAWLQALHGEGELSKAAGDNLVAAGNNTLVDNTGKDPFNRAASEMLQLGQQLGNEATTKVSVPAMNSHVYSSGWNEELGSKIVWMNNQNISAADIKLNPEHLGPISIRIDMQQDQANISFTATNSGVKEMLEASLPKLREMLGAQHLQLGDVNVSQNAFSGQGQHQQAQYLGQGGEQKQGAPRQDVPADFNAGPDSALLEVTDHIEQSRALVTQGLVSYYA